MKNLYIIYNYGRTANGQDITIGNALSREAAVDIVCHDWNHLTDREQKRIGSTYTVQVYSVPEQLEHMTADEIEDEMALDGLFDNDNLLTNSLEIDVNAIW